MELKELLLSNHGTRQILVKNTFWLGLAELVSKLIMFVVTVSMVRYMGPEGFGVYNSASSIVAITLIFSDLGVGTILQREVAKNKDRTGEFLGNALGIRIVTSVLVLVLTLLTLPFLGKNQNYGLLVMLVCLYCLSQQLVNIMNAVLSAHEKMEAVFVSRLVYYLGILVAALSVIFFKLGINALVGLYTVVTIGSFWVSLRLVRRLGVEVVVRKDNQFWKKVLRESSPLFGFIACSHIYGNADTLLITHFFGNRETGIYQAAYKILYAFQSVNLINTVVSPRVTVLLHEKKWLVFNKLSRMFWSLSLLGLVPLAMGITWKSNKIVELIYGSRYASAAPLLGWLIWSGVINYFRIYITNILIANGKQQWVFYSVLLGLIVNLGLNIWVMPAYGFEFASVSLLVAEVTILLVSGLAVTKR